MIEWDADGDGSYERFEHTTPFVSGGDIIHVPLTAAERTQAVDTTTPGLYPVRARLTDNGALDAADNSRRQLTVAGQLRVNAIPVAGDIATSTDEDTPVAITPAGSDADAQPEPLAYDIVTAPPASAGTLGAVSGGSVTFTPAPDFHGTTSFTYQARDGGPDTVGAHAASNLATVTITVVQVNDAPVAAADAYDAPTNLPLTVPAPGVLGNDTDEEGDALTAVLVTAPSHGTVELAADGSFRYVPEQGFQGVDSFTYAASDGSSTSEPVSVSLAVAPMLSVSDAPPVSERRQGHGVSHAEFVVTLSGPSATPVLVRAATADGTALAASDYQALDVELRFEPGQTRKFVRVRVLSDRTAEPQETFHLVLSQPGGAAILDGSGVGTILASS